MDIFSC